jgi:hypothetical protein
MTKGVCQLIEYSWFIQPAVSVAILIAAFQLWVKKHFDRELEKFKNGMQRELEILKIVNQSLLPNKFKAYQEASRSVVELANDFKFSYSTFNVVEDTPEKRKLFDSYCRFTSFVDINSIWYSIELRDKLVEFGNMIYKIPMLNILKHTYEGVSHQEISEYATKQLKDINSNLIYTITSIPKKQREIEEMIRKEIEKIGEKLSF